MKLSFTPYVIQPFDDWYIFPSIYAHHEKQLTRHYQMRLAELQYHYAGNLRDTQRKHQMRIADIQRQYQQDLYELSQSR